MALDRWSIKRTREITFFKLLGCGHGESFLPSDADPRRWGLLLCIEESAISTFDDSKIIKRWKSRATHEFRAILKPISTHGKWSGKDPFNFGSQNSKNSAATSKGVIAITRARIKWRKYPQFLRAIPPVSADVKVTSGLIASFGIGEAPIGLQGTFSHWESSQALRDFAFRGDAHVGAISATNKFNWYSEELFARFEISEIRGEL